MLERHAAKMRMLAWQRTKIIFSKATLHQNVKKAEKPAIGKKCDLPLQAVNECDNEKANAFATAFGHCNNCMHRSVEHHNTFAFAENSNCAVPSLKTTNELL